MKDLKTKLLAHETVFGLFLASGSMAVAEIAGGCGYDFVVLDGEHGQCDEGALFRQICALGRYPTVGLVRIPAFRPEFVKRMLDYGADGILAPMIEDAEQARAYAASLRYPPEGNRGMTGIFRASDYNRDFDNYYQNANRTLLCAAQIETAKGVENIEEIAAVEGIDLLFIGHSDLTSDYGCYKQFSDPRILAAEERIIQAAKKYNKAIGLVLRPTMNLQEIIDRGVHFICLGTDLGILQKALRTQLPSK